MVNMTDPNGDLSSQDFVYIVLPAPQSVTVE